MYSKQDVLGEYSGSSGQEPSPMKTFTAELIQRHYQFRLKGRGGGGSDKSTEWPKCHRQGSHEMGPLQERGNVHTPKWYGKGQWKKDDRGWKDLHLDLTVVTRHTALAFVGDGLMCYIARIGLSEYVKRQPPRKILNWKPYASIWYLHCQHHLQYHYNLR